MSAQVLDIEDIIMVMKLIIKESRGTKRVHTNN